MMTVFCFKINTILLGMFHSLFVGKINLVNFAKNFCCEIDVQSIRNICIFFYFHSIWIFELVIENIIKHIARFLYTLS